MSLTETWQQQVTQTIERQVTELVPDPAFRDMLLYSLLPAGKMFRPILTLALASDLKAQNPNHLLLAASLEIHHCYTLIHDDLPCMDDDPVRRGRQAAHIKYGEWQAVLAGDALLNLSFQILAGINSPTLPKIIGLYGDYTGANGLILGQYLDMSQSTEKNIAAILKIHELKTSRLMQLSLKASAILAEHEQVIGPMERLGYAIGINFQLLDDLCELSELVTGHEKLANPFLNFNPHSLIKQVQSHHNEMKSILEEFQLHRLRDYLRLFLHQTVEKINNSQKTIFEQTDLDARSISFLNSL